MIRLILCLILILLTILTVNRESVGAIEHEYLGLAFGILFLIHMRGKNLRRIFSTSLRGFFNLILILSFIVTLATGIATSTTAVHLVTLRGAISIYAMEIHQYGGYLTTILLAIHFIDKARLLRNMISSKFFAK